ncbi:hypothetical protein [Nocardioides albidus]|nr:hypothetical protein [Nocardioides albidus]
MEMLIGVAAGVWVAAAAVFTFGLARASAHERPFRVEERRRLDRVG